MNELDATCASCGTPLIPGAAFCHRCGTAVAATEDLHAGAPPAAPPVSAGDAQEHPAAPSAVGAPPPPYGGSGAAGTLPPPPPGSTAPPAGESPAPLDEGLARALRGGYPVRIADWLSRGWTVFTREGGLFLAFAAIGWALWMVSCALHATWPIVFLAWPLLHAGFMTAALVARRGERLQFSDFWLPWSDFLPLFLAYLVSWALLLAGLCTCGIVTVYLAVGYQFAYMLILDRRLDFWDALEASRKVVSREWIGLFGFALVLFLINLAGFFACTVGLILTVPLTACALVEAYADIFEVRGGLHARRSPPPMPTTPSV
jgi:hypothetical protein